jgi:hypothetical protein
MSTGSTRSSIDKLRRLEGRSNRNPEPTMNVLGLRLRIERDVKSRNRWTRRALVLLAANGALLGTSSAYAFWTATGNGSGSASTGTASPLTVTVTGITGLYPTEKTTIPVSVTNTNPYKVALATLVLNTVTPTGSGCAATDVTLDSAAGGVTANSYAVTGTLDKSGGANPTANFNVPIAVANLADTCQGAGHSFSLSFIANGASTT